jgi:UDP-GlcNAc:undecaprenyl-phosphate GlcNAc-1-phosphate transferase
VDWVPLLVSAAVAALIAPGMLRSFEAAGRTRENFRGRTVVFPAGAIAMVAGILSLALFAVAQRIFDVEVVDDGAGYVCLYEPGCVPGGDPQPLDNAPWILVLPLGVALLGLLDDLVEGPARGWRGHGAALLRGELSTGVLKAAGTLALVAIVLSETALDAGEYVLAVLLIVTTTNLFNLLDLRPGRSVKAFALLGVALFAATRETEAVRAVGAFAGPLLVLGLYDLRERAMLGDTGANVLGVLAGYWMVLVMGTAAQAVALAVVLALTVYGELRSITAAIERIGILRRLDELGRPRRLRHERGGP